MAMLSPRQPASPGITDIYVAVDACAGLGGQPYQVLAALKKMYEHTGRRHLHVIDTEQGFHEKANCTTPAFLGMTGQHLSCYARFIARNQDWVSIVSTPKCRQFRNELACKIIPCTVEPVVALCERMTERMQQEAFRIMRERGQYDLKGKPIHSPGDIDIRVDMSDSSNARFAGGLLNEAADKVLAEWKAGIGEITAFNPQNSKKYHKEFMAEMIKATQEIKAFAYAYARKYSPDGLDRIKHCPDVPGDMAESLIKLRQESHLFSQVSLPADSDWWEQAEAVQALRLTRLWPWSLKCKLSQESRTMLDTCHKNTADVSYLNLFTHSMPEICDPATTLFIVLTHDGPLINQFLEASTGVSLRAPITHGPRAHMNGDKPATYLPADIYSEYNLAQRHPHDYPHQAAWVGSEFAEFAYKEVLAALSPYIRHEVRRDLSEAIRVNKPVLNGVAYRELRKTLREERDIPAELLPLLTEVVEQTHRLEHYVRSDIEGHGNATHEGRYHIRREALLKKRDDLHPR